MNKIVQFGVYSLNINNFIDIKDFQYYISFFKIKIRLKNIFKIIAILNPRVEINIIIKNIIKDIKLAIKKVLSLTLFYI